MKHPYALKSPDQSGSDYLAYSIRRGAGISGLSQIPVSRSQLTGSEVRVRMHAVALNYRDLMVTRGQSGALEKKASYRRRMVQEK